MALRLRIVSDHRRLLGENSTVRFELGGSIGRSADNDWVLPDPLRYVSAHHARIRFRNGSYVLEDLSTNGVYMNDSNQPVGKQGCKLKNGDVLRLGEYQVVVTLESGAAQDSGLEAVPTSIEELHAGRVAQTDLGASLNLHDLLVTEGAAVEGVHNSYGQAVAVAPRAPQYALEEEVDEEVVARRLARLARAASRTWDHRNAAPSAATDVNSGLHAFCRGAGIDASQLPVEAQTRMLQLAGQLFREALVGLKDLQRSQHEICNRFRVERPSDADDPRPSLARSMIEDLVVDVLKQHETRRLDAVQWLREAAEGIKAHDRAVTEAMRTAFLDFIGRLDPKELDTRFPHTAQRWELFAEFYRNLTESPDSQLPHTFVETFANAYKAAIQSSNR